ncbi:BZ3500_MvSof-1268-A1-R1_Chr9g10713 [Microbotryum saponariae]|uniref:BZ3500_MvSof-1268-A1-R1_Chr9g10713 protein n=1 Tax=Microbotryum saponariae TaxID=289078 RepID=A0A2X0N0X6_9BASI|nr:BZ3501_MvSof-1269-A2-R1_Chr9g10461 [Microbotryum saponariae]SDA00572.1 BZ3500_MvSof-1268-A1-R1_Chr9g10713 [Microbotryum saponariae]
MASPSRSTSTPSTTTTTSSIPTSKELRHATPAQLQAAALQRLLKDTSKPVHIPSAPKEGVKQLRAPREMMRNVQGSSAGAGSGEFHVYKESRRREYERLKLMDEEEAYNKAKQAALDRQATYEAQAEAKTAKNRLKRQKKKHAQRTTSASGAGEKADQAGEEKDDGAMLADKKRKLGSSAAASGGAFTFKSAKERQDEDQDEDEEEGPKDDDTQRIETINNGAFIQDAITVPQVAPAKEAGVKIVDDDDF